MCYDNVHMKKYCAANGKITELSRTSVPVNDLAVLRGYGVFDFLKTVNGKLFLWREHWRRFVNSAKLLGLKVPVGEAAARDLVIRLLKKNKMQNGSVRLLLTGGATVDGMTPSRPNFFILIEDLYVYPPAVFERGAAVVTHEHERVVPEAKTTNYITAVRLQREKKRQKAIEILYHADGQILECATSNFFIVKDGVIITPQAGVLGGTIRNLVIKLAREGGLKVEERDVALAELASADEAFLTATNKDITPIVRADESKIGTGQPGPVTRQLMSLLADFMREY